MDQDPIQSKICLGQNRSRRGSEPNLPNFFTKFNYYSLLWLYITYYILKNIFDKIWLVNLSYILTQFSIGWNGLS